MLGDPAGNGRLMPLQGAEVQLADLVATTDPQGRVVFDGLPFGAYTALATAVNPLTGADPLSGTGAAQISAQQPEATITIVLTWPSRPLPPPQEARPEPETPTGSLTVRVVDASARHGGREVPIEPRRPAGVPAGDRRARPGHRRP